LGKFTPPTWFFAVFVYLVSKNNVLRAWREICLSPLDRQKSSTVEFLNAMENIMKYKMLLNLLVSGLLAGTAGSASAGSTYALDRFLFSANLRNSGDATETRTLNNWMDSAAGIAAGYGNANAIFDSKEDAGSFLVASNGINSNEWYLDVSPNKPGLFLLKFGTGGTGVANDTYYFENIGDLTKLVWSNAEVNFLTGGNCGANNQAACNTGRLSHYTLFTDPPETVPEPASLLLFALSLAGLASLRGRHRT
jgi:hypothetical protein